MLGQELALEVPGSEEGVFWGESPPCCQPEPYLRPRSRSRRRLLLHGVIRLLLHPVDPGGPHKASSRREEGGGGFGFEFEFAVRQNAGERGDGWREVADPVVGRPCAGKRDPSGPLTLISGKDVLGASCHI